MNKNDIDPLTEEEKAEEEDEDDPATSRFPPTETDGAAADEHVEGEIEEDVPGSFDPWCDEFTAPGGRQALAKALSLCRLLAARSEKVRAFHHSRLTSHPSFKRTILISWGAFAKNPLKVIHFRKTSGSPVMINPFP